MKIELEIDELVSILAWGIVFKNHIYFGKEENKQFDKKVFDKLMKIYESEKAIITQEVTWTDKPRYQPGEKK